MLTKGAVEDIIMRHLRPPPGEAVPALKKVPGLKKKVFISDWELRRLYKPGARMVGVPANAIVSPLSLDWLDYDGIQIIYG
ncbi:MAG: hypothetical protein COT18_09745 [Elusimicrobia bacterium CG08_land_8_20_14_0_20_59_10]|nr:MAG: hypothetical protein COT18_09745 [Elusimicrobia bacterium CG08_land_8_20_14_0_20_59_10]